MALSETSLKEIDSSIDIMELHKKFDDDWYNMYKPLTLENTLLSEGILTKDIRETLDELAAKTSKNEKRINALNKEMKENKDETDSVISDVSSRIHSLEQVQKETVFFRGIPDSSSEDFTDSSVFSVDASTRTLLIPNTVNFAPKVEYEDKDSEFTVVGTVDQQDSKIKVSHKSLSDVKLEKVMPNVFDDSTGIKDGDTIAEAMTKINDSICWIDLEDDPSVFTTNEGDRLLYNNE